MAYPGSLDNFTPKVDSVDDVMAADVNELQTAIEAIETELGIDPAGSATDLVTRLALAMNSAGYVKLGPGSTLTISSGVITVTGNYHKVDTQSSAASDDLDTVNTGATGLVVFLQSVNDGRNVVIKHATGNIYCVGGKDITLDTNYEIAVLVYDAGNTRWIAGKFPAGYSVIGNITGGGTIATGGFTLIVPATGSAALLAVANVFTANQTLSDVNLILGTTTGTKIGTATTQKLGFFNATPVVQPTALTAQETEITHSAPGTADYAIADLVNVSGYGFVTLDEGLTVLQVIANLQARMSELETKLQTLGLIA
jgi:hypothetical protein